MGEGFGGERWVSRVSVVLDKARFDGAGSRPGCCCPPLTPANNYVIAAKAGAASSLQPRQQAEPWSSRSRPRGSRIRVRVLPGGRILPVLLCLDSSSRHLMAPLVSEIFPLSRVRHLDLVVSSLGSGYSRTRQASEMRPIQQRRSEQGQGP